MKKSKFCVINDTINGSKRNVFATEDGAIDHARNILTGREGRDATLYVVEIRKVVSVYRPISVRSNREVEVSK